MIREYFKKYFHPTAEFLRVDDARSFRYQLIRTILQIGRYIRITFREFIDDHLVFRAMALTFATLLSIIPVLAISFSMFKLFGGGEWFMELLRPVLIRNLAPGSELVVVQRIEELIQLNTGLKAGGIGLIFLLLLVYGIFAAIEGTFNQIWGVTSRSGTFHKLSLYWGLVTIIPILVISSLALTTYLSALPFVHEAVAKVNFVKHIVNRLLPVLMVGVSFFLLYKFLPSTHVKIKSALIGALVASFFYEVTKFGFIFYSSQLVQYDIIYGSVAVIPILMIWVNLSWVIVLIGVETSYVAQHHQVLIHKSKHVEFSRSQSDTLAYLILTEVTLAFRGQRPPVSIFEWSNKRGAPPHIVSKVIGKLRLGGLIELTGSSTNEIILLRDPEHIQISVINQILSGEALETWAWSEDVQWHKVKSWLEQRSAIQGQPAEQTLGQLVELITEDSSNGKS